MTKTATETPLGGFITSFIRRNKVAVVTAPVLNSCKKLSSGAFQFQVRLNGADDYTIEASTDLLRWTPIDSGAADDSVIDYFDSNLTKYTYRFYRAICGDLVSKNVIGHASITLPPGFCMIANPFYAPSNFVGSLFPEMPEGTTLCKFDTRLFRLTNNSVKNGEWTNGNEKLTPGEGAIVFNPSSLVKAADFAGEVPQGNLSSPIPPGLSICSSLVPRAGRLDADLGFPMAESDVVHVFDRHKQKYTPHPYSAEEWKRNAPRIGIGESFWISKTQPRNWTQNFAL